MPVHKIEVSEYECVHCGYKWINRVNGKDGSKPKNCAKCKRFHWNGKSREEGYNPITPRERSMRMKLYKFEGKLHRGCGSGRQYRPNELCEKFLSLNPRPTMQELYEALYPLKCDIYKIAKKNRFRKVMRIPDLNPDRPKIPGYTNLKYDFSGWIPDPDKEGYIIPNPDPNFKTDWIKVVEEDFRLRKEVMKRVIESRGETVPKEKTEEELQGIEDISNKPTPRLDALVKKVNKLLGAS